jgi:branched-chain amino acid transport system permease protein
MSTAKRDLLSIVLFAAVMLGALAFSKSGVIDNFIMMALYAALLSQAWNILAGYGGQFSFGHALFFGTGAYVHAIAQIQWSLSAWLALPIAATVSALVGFFVGALSFRYGLKGSYFALVTLAFAEVFRIVALSVPWTGAGVGLMLPLREGAAFMQFSSRKGFAVFILAFVLLALLTTWYLKNSRLGAYLQAVRDNEDAARAVGVNPTRVKLVAIALSAAFMGVAGTFYLQVFQYIDPSIAFGPSTSVEALVGAIVGGIGTLWGPVVGAFGLHLLGDLTRNLFGNLPGLNMVIYGLVLIFVVMFAPRGIAGWGQSIRKFFERNQS